MHGKILDNLDPLLVGLKVSGYEVRSTKNIYERVIGSMVFYNKPVDHENPISSTTLDHHHQNHLP